MSAVRDGPVIKVNALEVSNASGSLACSSQVARSGKIRALVTTEIWTGGSSDISRLRSGAEASMIVPVLLRAAVAWLTPAGELCNNERASSAPAGSSGIGREEP